MRPALTATRWFRTGAAIFFVFLWGSAFVPSKIGVLASSPLWFLVVRFAVSGALALAIALALRRAVAARPPRLDPDRRARRAGERDLPRLHATKRCGISPPASARSSSSTNPLLLALVAPCAAARAADARKKRPGALARVRRRRLRSCVARTGTGSAEPGDVELALFAVIRERREHDRLQALSRPARRADDDRAATVRGIDRGAAVRDPHRGRAARAVGRCRSCSRSCTSCW